MLDVKKNWITGQRLIGGAKYACSYVRYFGDAVPNPRF